MSCFNSTIIHAPIDKVWAKINNFHDMNWAKPVVTSCQIVGNVASANPGAKRILNEAFHETLTAMDTDKHRFTYTIDQGPPPLSSDNISSYIGTVTLQPITANNHTFIGWQSDFQAKDDAAVGDFCNPLYTALLAALRESFS